MKFSALALALLLAMPRLIAAAEAVAPASASAAHASPPASQPTTSPQPSPQASAVSGNPAGIPSLPPGVGSAVPQGGSLFQVFLSLGLVLALLIAAAWALRRFGPQQISGGAHLRIVGGLSLGGRERVLVLEVGEQWIVIGAAPGRVSALATMPKQGESAAQVVPTDEKSFATWLKQIMEKRHDA